MYRLMKMNFSWPHLCVRGRGAFFALASAAFLAAGSVSELYGQNPPALINVSTRGTAGSGDNVMIAGFIVQGSGPRTVAIRAIGPSLVNYGIQGTLTDPTLTLNANGTDLATNDDWKLDGPSAAALTAAKLAPSSDREAALVRTLNPGPYTVIVGGKGSSTGVALVEVYDLDGADNTAATSLISNLSTRGRVGSGDNVMIIGFIIGGSTKRDILVTAVSGSLGEYAVSGALVDPKIQIFTASGQKIAESDDWINSLDFDTIARTGASPHDPLESAAWLRLDPGAYTAVVSGVNGIEGVALPEIYDIRGLRDIRFSPTTLSARTGKLAISTGASPEAFDFTFSTNGSATVNAGVSGTFSYTAADDFRATISVDASGYTLSGKLQFYRDKIAVFDGTLKKPGSNAQTAGGILILN